MSAWVSARAAAAPRADADETRLVPGIHYLRVTLDDNVALLALGYVDPDPRGPVEVWYSVGKEVIRLQNGRLVGVTGLPTEWRRVMLPEFPAWTQVAKSGELRWERVRDAMPGYRYGLRDTLRLRPLARVPANRLRGIDPASLGWFEERSERAPGAHEDLPPAHYAVDLEDGDGLVVYGEQCIAPGVCLTWQRWPAGS